MQNNGVEVSFTAYLTRKQRKSPRNAIPTTLAPRVNPRVVGQQFFLKGHFSSLFFLIFSSLCFRLF